MKRQIMSLKSMEGMPVTDSYFVCIMLQNYWRIILTSAQKSLCSQNAK